MRHTAFLSILFFAIGSLNANGQKERVRGIYETSDDFKKERLSFDNACRIKTIKIRLNDFFIGSYITIKQVCCSSRLQKKSIFGYRNCQDQIFRFNGKQELLLLNPGDKVLIYKRIGGMQSSGSRINVTNYYFSVGVEGLLQKLTIRNIKTAFADNKYFQQLVDENFKYNTDLARFDDWHNMYQLSWIIKKGYSNPSSANE